MEGFYITIIAILLILAIADLIVGVSNDALNFLGQAIGSKAATYKTILIVASIGILAGAIFSDGMMEIARRGIFNPGQLTFSDLMIICLSMMLADVLLLDIFNAYGLPTSTTVSLVFELLGATLGLALIKSFNGNVNPLTLINIDSAFIIVLGILLSLLIAFPLGALVQFITRCIFTFNYDKSLKYMGSIWGAISITIIMYFLVLKEAEHVPFIKNHTIIWIRNNELILFISCFLFFIFLFQFLHSFFRLHILKLVTLAGTFALAMAFASNDLVNFIGVPLAALLAYNDFVASVFQADDFVVGILLHPFKTPSGFLIISGLIMIVTIVISRKSRFVTQTALDLSSQNDEYERFKPSVFAQFLVRGFLIVNYLLKRIIPVSLQRQIDKRFDVAIKSKEYEPTANFDLIRASVNLVTASMLIAFGTAHRMPFSTTFVTFMVGMGSSLADRAWDRENAVYRVAGMATVLGGWFYTTMAGFFLAMVIAMLLYLGGAYALIFIIIGFIVITIRTHVAFRRIEMQRFAHREIGENITDKSLQIIRKDYISQNISQISELFHLFTQALCSADRIALKKCRYRLKNTIQKTIVLKQTIAKQIVHIEEENIEEAKHLLEQLSLINRISKNLVFLVSQSIQFINNGHREFNADQKNDIQQLDNLILQFIDAIIVVQQTDKKDDFDNLLIRKKELEELEENLKHKQIECIKSNQAGISASLLLIELINESAILHGNYFKLLKLN